jgi:hypothetical protein
MRHTERPWRCLLTLVLICAAASPGAARGAAADVITEWNEMAPPAFAPALVPHWGRMKPFVLTRTGGSGVAADAGWAPVIPTPPVTFTCDSFKAIADQIDEARVCAGIHVRPDQAAGAELGRRVGEHVCRTTARPLGGKPGECRL